MGAFPAASSARARAGSRTRPSSPTDLPAHHVDAIVRATTDAIVSVDERGRIVLFNRGAELLFGYAASDVLGHALSILGATAAPPAERELRITSGSHDPRRPGITRRPIRGEWRRRNGTVF